MVPNVVRLLAGFPLSEVVTTRLGLVIIVAGQKWVTMTSYNLALTGIKKALSCGYCICVEIPLWILRAWWKTQMFVLSLPYRCFERLLSALRTFISGLVDPPIRAATQEVLREFLTKQNSQKITQQPESATAATRSAETFDYGSSRCKNRAQAASEKRTDEETALAKDAKKLLRMTLAALKYLERLKGSRTVLDEQFRQTLEDLINISKSLSRMTDLNEHSEETGLYGNFGSAQNRFQKQAGLLKDRSEKRQGYYLASHISASNLTKEFINTSTVKRASVTDSELVCVSMEALQSLIYMLNAENFALKRRLKVTNDQLGGVKIKSKCLADKVVDLEVHLDKIKELLKTTEEERDEMCFKLFALSDIIEEQEMLLNDSSRRNNMDGLYNTTLDYLLSEYHGAEDISFDLQAMNIANVL